MDFRSSRTRRASLSLLLGGAAVLALTAPIAAQSHFDDETLVIGGGAAPRGSVTVDMGALDAIAGPYTPPASTPSRPGGRIVLTPPGGQSGVPRAAAPPAPPPARQQTAAVAPLPQPPVSARESEALRIGFTGENAALPEPSKNDLKGVVDTMTRNTAMRVQVKAYAIGAAEAASKARRTSLSRALAVRAYLIEQGIGSTRIDIRALGNNAEGGPDDRVDLVLVAR